MENKERFLVLHPDGREEEISAGKPIGSKGFWSMVSKEALKQDYQSLNSEPAYLDVCRRLGIAWEEMSDSGHMRYGPKGALVFDLLADYVNAVVRDLDLPLFQVKGTNMFNLQEGPVAEHAQLFGDRLYAVQDPDSEQRYVLRYAACHQQFAMIKHWQISHKHLPFGAYELADSYRLEQSGECMLAFRTRRLNMPDLHVFCQDDPQAALWFMQLHQRIMREVALFGQDYELLVNLSSPDAYAANRELLLQIARDVERPLLNHLYPGDRNYYWTVNLEYHIIDLMGRAREIGTVQIDVGNAERFGISYVDDRGAKRHPIILHTAIIGTIERFLYLLLDQAVQRISQGLPGMLPYWLSPEQLRLLPVSDAYVEHANQLAQQLAQSGVRVSVDDRPEKVGKKVREAHADWVPYQVVIGEKELAGAGFKLQGREEQQEQVVSLEQLIHFLQDRQQGYPWRQLYYPAQLSMRPVF